MWWNVTKVTLAAVLLAVVALTEPWWVTCCVSAAAGLLADTGADEEE